MITIFAICGILLLISVGGFYLWLRNSVSTPNGHTRAAEYIRIEKGTAPRSIVSQLSAEGIIKNESAAQLYLRLFADASKLQAGEYQFPSPISTIDVFKQLEKGDDRTIRLTIPEGWTRFDIAKRVAERVTSDLDEKAILALMDDTSLIRDIAPEADNLEGYLYPSTYNIPANAKPEQVIRQLVGQFRRFWKPEWSDAARAIGRTPHEVVTIASLIETETPVEAERPIVSGVIHNRLSRGMALGIDQTNVYIAKMLGRWDGTIHKSDLEVDSPYNTRKVRGLPPGPISSVTESSIRAALQPEKHEYIFYVLNVDANDGTHWFYSSAAEFEKGKAVYQRWLKRQRMEMKANEENTRQN
ncbi:MAG: endolytic transglycosylase MltG [Acidobacteriota bacterium]|nr:MAG: endolytic transglycosylase MltG [Acidobacteriota bacterium]